MLTTDKTMIAPAMGGEATIIGVSITCPICKTENAPTEKYCGECGFLLASTPVEEADLPDTAQMPRLADSSGREYLLKDGENTIGREATDVLLSDPTVSRRHAKITLEAGKAYIEDVGSSNGTYAAGARVEPGDRIEVVDGAELKFGSAILTVVLPAVEAEEPAEKAEVPSEEPVAEEAVVEEADPAAETEEPETVAPAGPEPAPVARLVADDKDLAIMTGTNTIGRRSGNTIILDGDPYVSGAHAEITAGEDGIWLTDVGSTNGTVVNGSRLQPNIRMALKSGDEIIFGQTTLTFEALDPVEPA